MLLHRYPHDVADIRLRCHSSSLSRSQLDDHSSATTWSGERTRGVLRGGGSRLRAASVAAEFNGERWVAGAA